MGRLVTERRTTRCHLVMSATVYAVVALGLAWLAVPDVLLELGLSWPGEAVLDVFSHLQDAVAMLLMCVRSMGLWLTVAGVHCGECHAPSHSWPRTCWSLPTLYPSSCQRSVEQQVQCCPTVHIPPITSTPSSVCIISPIKSHHHYAATSAAIALHTWVLTGSHSLRP